MKFRTCAAGLKFLFYTEQFDITYLDTKMGSISRMERNMTAIVVLYPPHNIDSKGVRRGHASQALHDQFEREKRGVY